ncbi:MAG: S9 family peptidase [Rhodanobacteraceae bacterium]|nr:S9 family peptidase [Rhodanobacteraceae bacterium]
MLTQRLATGLALLLGATGAHAEVPLADFARHTQYSSVKISPDGDYIAADTVVDNRRSIAIINLSDMKLTRIIPRMDEVVWFTWVGKQRLMYKVGEAIGGLEQPVSNGELYFVNADGTRNDILFGYRAGKDSVGSNIKSVTPERASGYLIDDLRDDDKNILIYVREWKSTAEPVPPVVYKFDTSDGSKKKLFVSPLRLTQGFLADHAGNVNFAYGVDINNHTQVMYRGKGEDEWVNVFDGSSAAGSAIPLAYDRDNKTVYWSCQPEGKVGGLCTWSSEDRTLKPIWSAKDVEMAALIKDFDDTTVVGVRAYPGRSAVGVINKKTPMIEAMTALMQQFPGETVEVTSVSKDGKRAIVLVHSDVNPGEFFLFDRESKKLSSLLKRVDKIKPEQMASMEPIKLKSRDGLELNGYLTRPLGQEQGKNLPLVVLVHGGPFDVRDYWGYDAEVQMLASRGYAVLQVNFRGSGGYGDRFVRAGYKQWGGVMQDDVTDATKWAIEQGIADPKRICIYGGSYGGYAALMGAVREPDLYRCAIGNAGVYDLRLMLSRGDIQDSAYGENYLKRTMGEDVAELAAKSPITQLDKIKANLMLIVGGQDKRVPPVHGESVHNALEQRGVKHEWLYQRTEAHGFYDEKNVEDMYTRMLAFLEANIGAASKAAP